MKSKQNYHFNTNRRVNNSVIPFFEEFSLTHGEFEVSQQDNFDQQLDFRGNEEQQQLDPKRNKEQSDQIE